MAPSGSDAPGAPGALGMPAPAVPRSRLGRTPSPVLVLGGIASVQLGSAVATHLFAADGPAGAVLLRLVMAAIVLTAITRPSPIGRTASQWRIAVLFGIVLAGLNLSFYEALGRIPLGIAVTIEFIGPLAVGIAGSRRQLDLVWVGAAALGIVALTHGTTHGLNTTGVLFGLLAALMWASYILVSARVGRAFDDGTGLAIAMWVSAGVALPFGIAEGGAHLLSARSLGLGLAVGILSSALPYTLELEALRRIATHVFGVLMSLEPAVAALAGLVILGQGLGGREVAGIGLVIVASLGASLTAPRAGRRGRDADRLPPPADPL